MTTPRVVEANPEFGWFSIGDAIWLAWREDGNLYEVHNPASDIGKPHAIGWIDVTSGAKHRIVQREPLTIVASILCGQGCGFHGFVTDGKWVSA